MNLLANKILYADTDSWSLGFVLGPTVAAYHPRRSFEEQTRGPYTLVLSKRRPPRLVASKRIVLPPRIFDRIMRALRQRMDAVRWPDPSWLLTPKEKVTVETSAGPSALWVWKVEDSRKLGAIKS